MKYQCVFMLRQARLRMVSGMEGGGRGRDGVSGESFNSVKAGRQELLLAHRQGTWSQGTLSQQGGVVALAGP